MEEIDDIVTDIAQGCAGKGQRVPKVLAAFIARTILESDPVLFSPCAQPRKWSENSW